MVQNRNILEQKYILFCKEPKTNKFLGIEKNVRLLMQSRRFFLFFLLPTFHEISYLSKTVHTIRTKFLKVILHHIRVLYVQWYQNEMTGM